MIHTLRDYQLSTIREVERHEKEGHREIVVVAPTGAGKTVMATAMIHERIQRDPDCRVLALAHRKELIDQLSAKLDENGLTQHGVIQANHWRTNYQRRIQVASIQTYLPRARRGQVPRVFDVVLVDEAHHTPANTYLETLDIITKATVEKHGLPPTVLGLTATPYRSDGAGLSKAGFKVLIQSASMVELMERGYLVPARYFIGSHADLDGIRAPRGDFENKELARRTNQVHLIGDIVANWKEHAQGRRTLAFCVDVKHSKDVAAMFNAAGIEARHVDAESSKEERERAFHDIQFGSLMVLCNVGLCTEGTDLPPVSCGILSRATKSLSLYLQMAGRFLRIFKGKSNCILLDHANLVATHGFLTDERTVSLEAGVGEAEDKKLTCPSCMAHLRSWPPSCPMCGADLPRVTKVEEEKVGQSVVREVIYADQSLVEVSPDIEIDVERIAAEQVAHRQKESDNRKKVFLRLVKQAEQNGFKPGWVYHKFKSWTGNELTDEDQLWSRVKVRRTFRGRQPIVAWVRDNELPLFGVDS